MLLRLQTPLSLCLPAHQEVDQAGYESGGGGTRAMSLTSMRVSAQDNRNLVALDGFQATA